MGRQGKVVGFERRVEDGAQVSYVKVDTGADVEEVQHLEPPGEDSPPIVGDFAAVEELGDSGTKHAVGYHDPKSDATSVEGDKRFVSRTTVGGQKIAELWMAQGAVTLKVFDPNVPVFVEGAKVVIKSSNVNLGGEGGRGVACEGDIAVGAVRALCGAPGSPIIPVPPATPTPTGGVPVAVQIVSGRKSVKAREA